MRPLSHQDNSSPTTNRIMNLRLSGGDEDDLEEMLEDQEEWDEDESSYRIRKVRG
jgi:hypothetical protein